MFKSFFIVPAVLTQIGQIFYGALIFVVVPFNLSISEQGIWFTLMALGSLSRLADMGFLNLVIIFSGYAKSGKYSILKVYQYVEKRAKRITYLVFPIIAILGWVILSIRETDSSFKYHWFLYLISLTCFFYLNFKLSFIEGQGRLRFAHFFRGLFFILSGLLIIFFVLNDLSTLSLGLSNLVSFLIIMLILKFFKEDYFHNGNAEIPSSEFDQLSLKTFFSWLGGYLGTHGITPTVYVILGEVASALVGLTINIFIVLQNLSNVYIVNAYPKIIKFVSNKSLENAKRLIYDAIKKGLISQLLLTLFFLIFLFNAETELRNRFLPLNNLIYLYFGFVFMLVSYGIAIYIRSFKEEPFHFISFLSGLIVVVITTITSLLNEIQYLTLGFFIGSLIGLIFSIVILRRKEFHD